MRLYEYEAKRILRDAGIPVPRGQLVAQTEEIQETGPAVVKAQVMTGGRQKEGGVVFTCGLEDTKKKVQSILGNTIAGYRVEKVLVEQRVDVEREFFAAVTYDTVERRPVVAFSTEGGVEVEEAARRRPEKVVVRHFDVIASLEEYQAREIASDAGLKGKELLSVSYLLAKVVDVFLRYDAVLLEINPLGITGDGRAVALDAHVEIDDDAVYRHPELESYLGISEREGTRPMTVFEQEAVRIDRLDHRGVAGRVIEFDGNLALLIGGGGASLTCFDAVRKHGGMPANYCEIGGNPSVLKVKELTKHLLSRPGVKSIAVVMNVVSNTRVDLVARGVIKGILELNKTPSDTVGVFRVPGAWEDEGFKILTKYGVRYCDRTVSIDEAARMAVDAVERLAET